ncbi:MAG: hypothetical protein GY757_02325 [bacterium]|nr:hypothetical protein [bacterium]
MKIFTSQLALAEGHYFGGGPGHFDPGEMAGEIMGELSYDRLLRYMLRRFGPPIHGHDPQKQLCRYIITTPMKGVYLGVVFSLTDYYYFIYFLEKEAERKAIIELYERPRKDFRIWARDTKRKMPISLPCHPGNPMKRALKAFYMFSGKNIEKATPKEIEEFREQNLKEGRKLFLEYINLYPEKKPDSPELRASLPENSFVKRGEEAMAVALEELKRPVKMGYAYMTAEKEFEPADDKEPDRVVAYYGQEPW